MTRLPWTVLFGVLCGVMLAPALDLIEAAAFGAWDRAYPVLDTHAKIIARTESEWRLVLWSHKYRDCELQSLSAYDTAPDGEIVILSFGREDGAPSSSMPPGKFRSAVYRVAPAPQHRLTMYFLHRCGDRIVRTSVPIVDTEKTP